MFYPCEHCYLIFDKEYTKECDDTCEYARLCLESKKYPTSNITFGYKLESARFSPSNVPEHKWHEYFVEVFDMLRKYEEVRWNLDNFRL